MHRYLITVFSLVFFGGAAGFTFANPTSQALVDQGRALLFNGGDPTYSGIQAARDKFEAAVAADITDQEAHFFYGVTRVPAFALDQGSGGGIETLRDLLEAFGVTRSATDSLMSDQDPFQLPEELNGEYDPPATVPGGETVRAFFEGAMIDLLDAAIADLAEVGSSFTTTITAAETGDTAVEVDYGDVLCLRSASYALKSLLHLLTAYDWDVELRDLFVKANANVFLLQRDLLDAYPDLLDLRPSGGSTALAASKQALIASVTAFEQAYTFITSEADAQGNDLLFFGSQEEEDEAGDFVTHAVEIRNSLSENRAAIIDNPEGHDDFSIDANYIYGNTGKSALDIRSILPEYSLYNEEIPGTFPGNPVLNGILPDLSTNDDLTEAMDLEYTGFFTIPTVPDSGPGSITLDGSSADWPSASLVFTDLEGDEEIDFTGMDIRRFRLAKDSTHLYTGIELYDDDPWRINYAGYAFQANQSPGRHFELGNRANTIYYYSGGWNPSITEQDFHGSALYIQDYPSSYAADGTRFIEWKVSLPDMGTLSGRFVLAYSHYIGSPSHPYDPTDYTMTSIMLDSATLSGTIACPSHNGTGHIFLYALDGPDPSTAGRISSTVLDAPGSYSLLGLGAGSNLYLFAVWDADDNGIVTGADTTTTLGPVTLSPGASTYSFNLETGAVEREGWGLPWLMMLLD